MQKQLITTIVACAIVGGLAFAGGMMAGKRGANGAVLNSRGGQFAQAPGGQGFSGRAGGQGGPGGATRGGAFGGLTNGEILSKDSTGLTLKLRNGGSQIIFVTPTTKTEKMVEGTLEDLAVGKSVTIMGTANSDGSLTAQSIQLRPAMLFGASSTTNGVTSSTKP